MSGPSRVGVLGGGAAGLAAAAALALQGHDVVLFNRSPDRVAEIQQRGGLDVEGAFGDRFVPLRVVTGEPEAAVTGADLLLVTVPAYGQVSIVEQALPHLRPDHTLILLSGSCGSLEVARLLKAAGHDIRSGLLLGETMTMICSGRFVGPSAVRIKLPARVRMSAFPGFRTSELAERVAGVMNTTPRPVILDPGLNNPNFLIHPAPMLLNYAAVERADGELSIMNEGMTPGVLRCMDAVDAERVAVCSAFGVDGVLVDDLYRELGSGPHIYRSPGEPFGLKDRIWPRYIFEDVPYGSVLIASLGALAGVPTPVCDSINCLFSVVEQVDFGASGRTTARLGLDGLDVQGVMQYLETGERVSLQSSASC